MKKIERKKRPLTYEDITYYERVEWEMEGYCLINESDLDELARECAGRADAENALSKDIKRLFAENDKLKQQRDELIERLLNICIDANKHGIRYITAQKTLSKITGKSWEEIKGGNK